MSQKYPGLSKRVMEMSMDNSTVNDIVIGGIDQFLPQEKLQRDIFERVDVIVGEAVESGNPSSAFGAMKSLLGISQISGIAFAKFVYVMKFQWGKFNQRDSFEASIEDNLGRGKKAVNDNYRVWEMLVSSDIPREYCDKLKTMPVRCLIPIANMWKQDWEISNAQWSRLANAPDPSTIGKIIREIKGKEPKKGSLQIEWMAEEKELTIWKDGRPHVVYLQFDEKDEVILAGLSRLMGDGRVMEK